MGGNNGPTTTNRTGSGGVQALAQPFTATYRGPEYRPDAIGGFCRNCLAEWYVAAASEQGIAVDYEQARTLVYGMPYSEWKDKYQTEATAEQLAAYARMQEAKHDD